MALTWTGEDEVDTVITAFEATSAFAADDPEAVVAALFAALIEALFQGQNSGLSRIRWAELLVNSDGDRCAPITAMEIMNLASKCHLIRAELSNVASGPTAAQDNAAAEGDTYDTANLHPAH